ncbi:30S ribosomal protein S1 [Peptoanaerobacter stomatis]|uniref:S1 motif domain-containing protein n=3 Tax=Peptoanaerobacter stomatis TaxID=796937 RepID=G9XAK6_9FIRM|nr:S1 RNA-binding domain-containing protein [Peptoanaerobacter stomatis]EHL20026.1 hypothetical protein HMPREF9628_01023 [Peptoanaerobacter stomatis]
MSDTMEQLLLEQENNYHEIYRGTVIEGTVLVEKSDAYYVDLQYKTDGILPKSEMFDDEEIHVGDKLKLLVIKIDKNNGEIILSKKRVDEISAWEDIQKGDIITVKGQEVNSKGLIVAYKGNIKGFLPLSHIELKYINEDIAKSYIGKEFEAEILDIDPKKRRLILSRKSILQKVQDEKLKELSETIQEGKVFKGIVKDIKDYGIFIDIGGIVGLVHVSEISWARNKKIKDSFELEQEVEVQVLSYTPEEKRLSLSIKSLEPNPWDEYVKSHKEGDIVDGEVKNIKDYGAFISLYPIVDGFVHISNLSEDFVKNPSEILKTGDKVKVKIIGINPEEKKIELSMLLEDKKQEEPEVQQEQNETEV